MASSNFEVSLRDCRKRRDFTTGNELIKSVENESLSAEEWHEIGRYFFVTKEYGPSQQALLRAASLYPDGITNVAGDLSLVCSKAGKSEASMFFGMLSRDPRQHLRIVRQLISDPDTSQAVAGAAKFLLPSADYHVLLAEESLRRREYERAEAAASDAVREKSSPEALMLLARAKLGLKKYAEAEVVVRGNPNLKGDYLAYEILSIAREHANDHGDALVQLQKALSLNPALRSGPGRIARLKFALGDAKGAKVDIRVALDRMPKQANNWALAGHVETSLGNHATAVEYHREEERLTKSYMSALNLAHAYRRHGNEIEYRRHLNAGMERTYSLTRTTWDENKNLFILLAPGGGPILRKHRLPGSALYVVDNSATYFTLCADHIARNVLDLVESEKFENIVFIGSSKGAFGALTIGALVAKSDRCTATVKTLAFSPQVKLYPFNANLAIPSYSLLMKRAKESEYIREALEKYGNAASLCTSSPKLEAILLFGRGYRMDAMEASLMSAPNVETRGIAFSGHGILMCYTIPPGLSSESIAQKYTKLKGGDADMAALGASDGANLIDEMAALYFSGQHTLDVLLAEVLPRGSGAASTAR